MKIINAVDKLNAARWIKRLKEDTEVSATIRKEYLKVLLFLIQKRSLLGPFSQKPPKVLECISEKYTLKNIAKNFLVLERQTQQDKVKDPGFRHWPPYHTAYSSDLTEYVATQLIPKFGVQLYLAVSSEPLDKWNDLNKAQLPKGLTFKSDPTICIPNADPELYNVDCFLQTQDDSLKHTGLEQKLEKPLFERDLPPNSDWKSDLVFVTRTSFYKGPAMDKSDHVASYYDSYHEKGSGFRIPKPDLLNLRCAEIIQTYRAETAQKQRSVEKNLTHNRLIKSSGNTQGECPQSFNSGNSTDGTSKQPKIARKLVNIDDTLDPPKKSQSILSQNNSLCEVTDQLLSISSKDSTVPNKSCLRHSSMLEFLHFRPQSESSYRNTAGEEYWAPFSSSRGTDDVLTTNSAETFEMYSNMSVSDSGTDSTYNTAPNFVGSTKLVYPVDIQNFESNRAIPDAEMFVNLETQINEPIFQPQKILDKRWCHRSKHERSVPYLPERKPKGFTPKRYWNAPEPHVFVKVPPDDFR